MTVVAAPAKIRNCTKIRLAGPRNGRDLAAAAVEHEAQEGRQDQDVDRRVLGRHHAEVAEHRMGRAAHRLDLIGGGNDRARRRPDGKADGDHHQHRPDEGSGSARPP